MGRVAAVGALLVLCACGSRTARPGGAAESIECEGQPGRRSASSARLVVQQSHTEAISRLAISASGLLASSSDKERSIRIWDLSTGSLLRVIRQPFAGDLAWRGDELLLGGASDDWRGEPPAWWVVGTDGAAAVEGTGWRTGFLRGPTGSVPSALEKELGSGGEILYATRGDGSRVELKSPGSGWGHDIDQERIATDRRQQVLASISGFEVAVWDLTMPEPVAKQVRLAGFPADLALSPDGRHLAVVSMPTVVVGTDTAATLAVLSTADLGAPPVVIDLPIANQRPTRVLYSPDGAVLVVLLSQHVIALHAASLQERWRYQPAVLDPSSGRDVHASRFDQVAFTHDGSQVVAALDDGAIEVLDVETGRRRVRLGTGVRVPETLRFAGDEVLLAATSDHVTAWSLTEARPRVQAPVPLLRETFVYEGDLVTVRSVNCHDAPARRRLFLDRWRGWEPPEILVRSADRPLPYCSGYPATTDRLGPGGPETRGAFATVADFPSTSGWIEALDLDGRIALIGAPSGYAVLDLAEGGVRPIRIGPGTVRMQRGIVTSALVEKLPAGRRRQAITHKARIEVWDASLGSQVGALELEARLVATGPEALTAVAEDRDALVAGLGTRAVRFSLPAGTPRATLSHDSDITAVALSKDRIIAGGSDGALVVQGPGRPAVVGRSPGGPIQIIAVAPSGKVAATVSADGGVRIWDLDTGTVRATLVDFLDDEYIAFAPDGRYAGSAEAATRVRWVFSEPLEAFPVALFAAELDRPELVRGRLAGAVDAGPPPALWRPPAVTIAAAPAPHDDAGNLVLRVRARSDGIVERVRLFADARPVDSALVCAREGEVLLRAPLGAGVTRLAVQAYDEAGYASNVETLDVTSPDSGAQRDLWLVAAGVSRYPELDARYQLQYADDDAEELAAALAAVVARGSRYRRLHATVLVDGKVDRGSLLEALRGLSEMGPDDTAVVLLAGHGVKPEQDAPMVFLTAEDGLAPSPERPYGIGWEDMATAMASARGRVVVLLDACHSGHITQEVLVPNDALVQALVGRGAAGVFVLAAAKGRQLSYETAGARSLGITSADPVSAERGHGIFTRAVIDSIDAAASDVDGDGTVQLSELVAAVVGRVHDESGGHQTPWVARDELIGDFGLFDAAGEPNR